MKVEERNTEMDTTAKIVKSGIARRAAYSLVVFGIFFCAACAGTGNQNPSGNRGHTPPQPQYVTHEIRFGGETLAMISNWYTGRSENWRQIAAANPGLRPERMRIGQTVLIPRELAIRTEPLPSSLVRRPTASVKQEAPIVTPETTPTEVPSSEVTATQETAPTETSPETAATTEPSVTETAPSTETTDSSIAAPTATDTPAESTATTDAPAADQPKEMTPEEAERAKLLDELLN